MDYTELDHLERKDPVVSNMYYLLIEKLQKFGSLKIEPQKKSIHLSNRFGFAGVIQGRVILIWKCILIIS